MNLLRAASTVSLFTLASRITGLAREAVVAASFGASGWMDAFQVAFRIPNLLRRLFAEGAFSQAFVPILAEYKNRRGDEATRTLVDHVTGVLGIVLLLVTAAGVLTAPWIIAVTAPGFSATPEKFALTVDLLRITFPYIVFIALTALAGGILNTWGRFAVPAVTPVLLNLSFIGFALIAAPWFDPPVKALAWAVFAGGVLQLAFQLPFLARIGMFPRPRPDLRDEGVRRVLRQMGPAVFGVSVGQLSLLINNIFASFLITGSVTWLYFADRLMEFPMGLLGVALGTILLPSLSKRHAQGSTQAYSELLDWGLRLTLLLAVPCAVALAVLALPLVATLFHYGAFTATDVINTRNAVIAYSIGLVGLIAVKVLAPGFYARQDIRTPVKIALVTLIFTQLLNLVFVWQLRHAGLALAISVGACLNAGLLLRGLRKRAIYVPRPGWGGFVLKLALAVYVMGAVLWVLAGNPDSWLTAGALERVLRMAMLVFAGAGAYGGTLWLLGFRPGDFAKHGG